MAVLVVVKTPEHVERMMHWAWHVAQGRREGLTVLALTPEGPEVVEEHPLCQPLPHQEATLTAVLNSFGCLLGQSFKTPDMSPIILRHGQEQGGLSTALSEVDRLEPSLLIVNGADSRGFLESSLAQKLYDENNTKMWVSRNDYEELGPHCIHRLVLTDHNLSR